MPNWCRNDLLVVTDNKEDLDKVTNLFENPRPFAAIYPEPDYDKVVVPFSHPQFHEGETAVAGRRDAWYDWRNENWGVKWDLTDPKNTEIVMEKQVWNHIDQKIEQNGVHLTFETPWSSPVGVINKLASQLSEDTVVINYFIEPGMQFFGFHLGGKNQHFVIPFNELDDFKKAVQADPNLMFAKLLELYEEQVLYYTSFDEDEDEE